MSVQFIQQGRLLSCKKLADFADFFHDAGHGLDDMLDVRRRVLAADGEAQATFGPGGVQANRFQDGGGFGIAGFAGGAAAGRHPGHVQVNEQVVAAHVFEGEAGVVGQPLGGVAGEDDVVGGHGSHDAGDKLVTQAGVVGYLRLDVVLGQLECFGRAHGKSHVDGAGATAVFLPTPR